MGDDLKKASLTGNEKSEVELIVKRALDAHLAACHAPEEPEPEDDPEVDEDDE